ncbi:hypothetical protein F5Y11DRAFT_339416 [Daldinia sp. FL1419]|nr:hypothetical protein F5Y11DRAFT_339416 [Daldinia sp. FL1419]
MSSITTAIPTGLITEWCLGAVTRFDGSRLECAAGKPERKKSDFQTFCCNGDILNVEKDIWRDVGRGKNNSMAIADMICCGKGGAQEGGIHPLPTAYTACSEGAPTPLASVAGTNTDNAAPFRVTYTSASFGAGTEVGDYIPTETPTCFWAYTVGVGTTEITLPTPDITTLPPDTTDEFGFTIVTPSTTTTTTASTTAADGASETESSSGSESEAPKTTVLTGSASQSSDGPSEPTSTPSGASAITGVGKGYIYLGLGLVTMSLLWS